MTIESTSFKNFADIKRRKNYSESHTITIDNFHSLIGDQYNFKEEVHCQVERDGNRCDQLHKKGWLARRKDSAEALIGNNCGTQYFVENAEFRKERSRVASEGRIESHLTALSELLSDRPALLLQLHELDRKRQRALELRRSLELALPAQVVSRLRDMVKTGNRSISVEAQFLEDIDEKGRETKVWRRREVGTVRGVAMWDDNRDLWGLLDGIEKAINETVISKDQKESQLRKWRETMENLPFVTERIETLGRVSNEFMVDGNLALLCFLVKNQDLQIDIIMLALKSQEAVKPNRVAAQRLLNELNAQVKAATGGLNIRVA